MPEKLKRTYIVREHPVRIISKCKAHSKGTFVSYLIGFCILYAVINWVPYVLSIFFPATNVDLLSSYADVDPMTLKQIPPVPLTTFIYMMLFNGVFKLSECLYSLTYIRNRKADYSALTESLPFYLKTLGIFVLQTLVVSFWTMIFVIPGILAALNFSQAYFILADDPDKSVTQVLAESKIMMYGNRWNYVRLHLYYIPYLILSYIPAVVLSGLLSGIELSQTAIILVSMFSDLFLFWAYAYISMGRTVFYELIINKGFAYFRYAGQSAFRELENPENIA